MNPIPLWALALAYWLHLIATVVWVGGVALMALLIWPGARAALGVQAAAFLQAWHKRFNPLAWLSLAVLTGTGMVQMAANPNYDGLLRIENAWSAAILVKHLAALGMVGVGVAQQQVIQPALNRLLWLQARGQAAPPAEIKRWHQRETALMWLNVACAMAVLACTAIASAYG